MAGTYVRRLGAVDAMSIILSPYNLQINRSCLTNRKLYGLVFGPDEDYDKLIQETPATVAQQITATQY